MGNSYLLKRYAIVTVVTIIVVMIISYLLEVFLDHDIGSVAGMIAVFAPAMDAGQAYARREKAKPAGGYAWKLSGVFLMINAAIGIAFMAILSLLFGLGSELFMVLFGIGALGLIIITVVVVLLNLLLTRFFFGFGVKNELKMQEKLASEKEP